MGGIVSTPGNRGSPSRNGDEDAESPSKRRRFSSSPRYDIDHLLASPGEPKPGSTLRLDVSKILHKDSKRKLRPAQEEPPSDAITSKALCRVTISDTSSARSRLLVSQSQIGQITTFKNPAGPHQVCKFRLPKPFFFPKESMLINRRDDGMFDFSDSYEVLVELEAAGGGPWPPLDKEEFGLNAALEGSRADAFKRYSIFSTRFSSIVGRNKTPVFCTIDPNVDEATHETTYLMETDLKWTAGFRALNRLEKGLKAFITAVDSYPDLNNGLAEPQPTNGVNGHDMQDESSFEQDDVNPGEMTPSRSLRAREKKQNYNLKVLSDQAQGRARKRRRRDDNGGDDGKVKYFLPENQALSLDFHRCIACGAYHATMEGLITHLKDLHSDLSFELVPSAKEAQFRVTRKILGPRITLPSGAVDAFTLDTVMPSDAAQTDMLSPSRDFGSPSPAARHVRKDPPKAKQNVHLVPNIEQPLFHPLSKARLRPGDPVPTDKLDNGWLIHKHLQSLDDFTDLTPQEVEYLKTWDEFILNENITSSAYLPRAWVKFTEKQATWLVSHPRRMIEYSKHVSALFVREILDNDTIWKAMGYLNIARELPRLVVEDFEDKPRGEQNEAKPANNVRLSASGCTICRLPVFPPRLLICSNRVSFPLKLRGSTPINMAI